MRSQTTPARSRHRPWSQTRYKNFDFNGSGALNRNMKKHTPPKKAGRSRDDSHPIRKAAKPSGPSFLQGAAQAEFTPEVLLVRTADIKPRRSRP